MVEPSAVMTDCHCTLPADNEPPKETLLPFTVIDEFASLSFAIEPANWSFVIPVPNPLTLVGKVTVFADILKV